MEKNQAGVVLLRMFDEIIDKSRIHLSLLDSNADRKEIDSSLNYIFDLIQKYIDFFEAENDSIPDSILILRIMYKLESILKKETENKYRSFLESYQESDRERYFINQSIEFRDSVFKSYNENTFIKAFNTRNKDRSDDIIEYAKGLTDFKLSYLISTLIYSSVALDFIDAKKNGANLYKERRGLNSPGLFYKFIWFLQETPLVGNLLMPEVVKNYIEETGKKWYRRDALTGFLWRVGIKYIDKKSFLDLFCDIKSDYYKNVFGPDEFRNVNDVRIDLIPFLDLMLSKDTKSILNPILITELVDVSRSIFIPEINPDSKITNYYKYKNVFDDNWSLLSCHQFWRLLLR
jgi:hypothetical protein